MAGNPDSGRNKDTQANRYRDPEYRKRKKAEAEALDRRAEELAGPVTVTKRAE